MFGEATLALLLVKGVLASLDLGSSPDIAELVQAGLLWVVLFIPLSGVIGGVVGGSIALTAGLALALSGRRVIGQMHRARLVTGSAAAAVPLAVAYSLNLPRASVDYYVIAAGLAAVAAVTAVLLTPRIVNGPPPPRDPPRADAAWDAGQSASRAGPDNARKRPC
jgi:hypothetical protein